MRPKEALINDVARGGMVAKAETRGWMQVMPQFTSSLLGLTFSFYCTIRVTLVELCALVVTSVAVTTTV
jgi:hypothetical protein